jgi:asparagine synthase (glutamine-hydrolysing)
LLRYVGFLWDCTNREASGTAKALESRLAGRSNEWRSVLDDPGLILLTAPSRFACYAPHILNSSAGAVLGVLFDRRDPLRSSTRRARPFFAPTEVEKISRTGGRWLVETYWGRYVAFLSDVSGRCRRVLRDPLGDIPCYRARVHDIDVYFSALPDLLRLQALQLTVNWDHLATRIITGNAWADESALNEIETVHPGECFEHRGEHLSRQYYWHPFSIALANPIEDFDTATHELRVATQACAASWGSLHERAVHILSGGLDSSIVLGCIAKSTPGLRVSCLNFRTRDPDSDERRYARLAAEAAGCELVEIERSPVLALERLFDCTPTVGPVDLVMRGLEVQPKVAEFAHSRQATAVFSGDGGDLIFFRGWPQLAVMDHAYQRGLGPALVKFALEASLPSQLSVWRLLTDALRHGTFRREWDIKKLMLEHYRLVTDVVVDRLRQQLDFLNPWKSTADDVPPGKRFHIFGATRPSLFRDPLPQEIELDIINPLMSQPVIEVCLRIPTYLHAAHGKDRTVARAAFAAVLPPAIAQRTWKGAADRHFKDLMLNNMRMLCELLIEGALVKAGLVDRERLAAALSGAPSRSMAYPTEIFGYACTEVWLSRWGPSVQQAKR